MNIKPRWGVLQEPNRKGGCQQQLLDMAADPWSPRLCSCNSKSLGSLLIESIQNGSFKGVLCKGLEIGYFINWARRALGFHPVFVQPTPGSRAGPGGS